MKKKGVRGKEISKRQKKEKERQTEGCDTGRRKRTRERKESSSYTAD